MPTDNLLLVGILLLVALLVGWLTGRSSRPRTRRTGGLPGEYFRGLNFLLNEEPDKALEVFIRMVEVDSETLETHFALGSLFRRRGEVDRAIRIHQNLIARPNLSRSNRTQALFELGEDYLKAGLLDRAESLFAELSREKSHVRPALERMITIFEQQKDWEKAIDAARQLGSVSGQQRSREVAHYYCELAERDLQEHNWRGASRYLRRAWSFDRNSVRVSLLSARLAEGEDDLRRAVRHYQQALTEDPGKAALILPALGRLLATLGWSDQFDETVRQAARERPDATAMIAAAALRDPTIGGRAVDECIQRYLETEAGFPGLVTLHRNLESMRHSGQPLTVRQLARMLLEQIHGEGHRYRCVECGYHARTLYWQCPSCRCWDSFRPELDLVLTAQEGRPLT